MLRKCIVLVQYREKSEYNDFIGRYYHFPKKYLSYFPEEGSNFIYFEPAKQGEGVYFGCGKINKKPFTDKKIDNHYFIEIDEYHPFLVPVKGPLEDQETYNPQNSVRNIDSDLYEKICLDGKIQLNFKVDSHLIKILGEQLIASEEIGILELIKNAYDAQATYCNIRLENVPTLNLQNQNDSQYSNYIGPVIVIEDDGIGMNQSTIENGWLRPATTIKTNIKEKLKIERKNALESGKIEFFDNIVKKLKIDFKNRIPLGEKGVGRFATHRLGRYLYLTTKTIEKDFEYVLDIDWNKFDNFSDIPIDLENIGVNLYRQPPSRDYGESNSGTRLIIYGGREGFSWDEKKIIDLNTSLINLNSPNSEKCFNVNFSCPQLPNLQKTLIIEEIPPIFTFKGKIDENGIICYELQFDPPLSLDVPIPREDPLEEKDLDLRELKKEDWKDGENYRKPKCGPFEINLNIWYRQRPWVDGPNAKILWNYLDANGGISIFRDGINIYSAGKGKEDDWLGLSRAQVKKYVKISYYHMIGGVELDQAYTLWLEDKTNREGFIENQAFLDLKNLILIIIQKIVQNQYMSKRDLYYDLSKDIIRDPKKLKKYIDQGTEILDKINNSYPIEDDPFKLLTVYPDKDTRRENLINLENSLNDLSDSVKAMESVKDLLTEQAGYGLAIAVSIHEIAKITSNFYIGVTNLIKNGSDIDKLITAGFTLLK